MRTSNGSVAGFPLRTVKCALLLLFFCVGSPVIPAFGEEDQPMPLPAMPEMPGPPTEPQEVHEQGIPDLAKEFDLSPQEALILQPLLHKLSAHRTAERVLTGQRNFRISVLESRLQYFKRAMELGTAGALNNIKRFNAYEQELLNLWRGGINCNPAEVGVRVWLPPDGNRPGRKYGWLELKKFPSLQKQLADECNKRLQKWNLEQYSFALTWPDLPFQDVRKLKARAEEYAKEIQSLRAGPAREKFTIHYPVPTLGSVNLKQLQARVESIKQRIAVLRTEIRAGRLVMKSPNIKDQIHLISVWGNLDDLTGWVTRQQILDRIKELKKKRQANLAQHDAKTLRVFRHTIGWTDALGLEKSIAGILAKAKEMSDQIVKGEYQVRFAGLEDLRSLSQLDEEIKTIEAHIKRIPGDPTFWVPVLGFGPMTLGRIQQTLRDKKDLTPAQRANLQRGIRQMAQAKTLEVKYWRVEWRYRQVLRGQLVPGKNVLDLGFIKGKAIRFALPAYFYLQWDGGYRNVLASVAFKQDRNHIDNYYGQKITHLTRCLAEF